MTGEQLLAERIEVMTVDYEQLSAARGEGTPNDELEFHLYHLACYWSRLIGFCRQKPDAVDRFVNSDLGACVAVGSEFLNRLLGPGMPTLNFWEEYWRRTQIVLCRRPVALEDIELAGQAFQDCLSEAQYDPWKRSS